MAKIDSRIIELPSDNGAVYVVKDGHFATASYVESTNIGHEEWTFILEDDTEIQKEVVTWTSAD